jgi:hypothetical protein
MMTGFGRKGSPAGIDRPTPPPFGAARTAAPVDQGLSPQARAFLAAERNRKGAEARATPSSAYETAALLKPTVARAPKSLVLAYVLWWFGATIAAHRFYLGAFRSALAMAGLFWGGLVLGFLMSKQSTAVGGMGVPPLWVMMIMAWFVWCFVDLFLIPGLRRRQAEGRATQGLATVFA